VTSKKKRKKEAGERDRIQTYLRVPQRAVFSVLDGEGGIFVGAHATIFRTKYRISQWITDRNKTPIM